VDERDLNLPVTVGARLTSGSAARIRSASAKCSPAAALGGVVGCSWPSSNVGQGPVVVIASGDRAV
jgi:hypothetical protein